MPIDRLDHNCYTYKTIQMAKSYPLPHFACALHYIGSAFNCGQLSCGPIFETTITLDLNTVTCCIVYILTVMTACMCSYCGRFSVVHLLLFDTHSHDWLAGLPQEVTEKCVSCDKLMHSQHAVYFPDPIPHTRKGFGDIGAGSWFCKLSNHVTFVWDHVMAHKTKTSL